MAEIDLRVFLSPESEIPPDVLFRIQAEEEDSAGESCSKTIGAHRLILGVVSPVFRKMFFGLMKETSEAIDVKETTVEAFEAMIAYIYKPLNGEEDTFNISQIKCPQRLFQLLALAERYQILKLVTLTSEALNSLAITRENMIFTATVANKYKTAFEDVATNLLVRCFKFLVVSDGGDVCELILRTVDNFPGANLDILREMIDVGYTFLKLPNPGWGKLVFFDVEEHEIKPDPESKHYRLANLPNLGAQWKVIFDLKPVKLVQAGRIRLVINLCGKEPGRHVRVGCMFSKWWMQAPALVEGIDVVNLEIFEIPKLFQWTRVEVTHERFDGEFLLTLALDGKLVAKFDAHPELQRMTDVFIAAVATDSEDEGTIKRIVVLGN